MAFPSTPIDRHCADPAFRRNHWLNWGETPTIIKLNKAAIQTKTPKNGHAK